MRINIEWNQNTYSKFIQYLKSIGDNSTKEFNEKILNTNYEILGIKTPVLKTIAKDISKTNIYDFLALCGSTYYEEVMIHGFILSYIEDPNVFLNYFYDFLQYIDSWGICDSCVSYFKIMKKEDFSDVAYSLILDSREFYVRVGYIILLNYYIDEDHIENILSLSMKESDYYYVNMAIAWLLSVCFVKFRLNVLELLKSKKLNVFVQNKTISKIRDSFRISQSDKDLVKKYIIK